MEKLKSMSIKQKIIILFLLLTLVLVGIILLVPRNSKFSIAKIANSYNADGDEVTAFVITVKDANNNSIVLSNSRFIIKEVTIVNDQEVESDPVDVTGNVLGTEEVVNGETVRVFETDENGVIEANFRDGSYMIEQIEAKEGYQLSEVQYFGVNVERGSYVELISEEPLYTGYTDGNSTPDSFCVEGREDGSALYYNLGYLSYINSENTVVWSKSSDLVYQIIARDDGFDVLTDSAITQYDNSGNITNTISLVSGMKSFAKDANGNFVITGSFSGDLTIAESSTASGSEITLESTTSGSGWFASDTEDIFVLTLNSSNLVTSAYNVEGSSAEVPESLTVTTDGNYVIAYVVDSSTYNILKMNSSTGAIIATVETDVSGRSADLIHYVAAGNDGSVYYGGNFSGTITYTADETVSGEEITLTSDGEDGLVVKYDSDMKIEWAINLGGSGGDHFFKADITPDGGFVMGGDSDTGAITIAAENTQSGYSITSTPDSENVGTWRGITVKVNSEGKATWAKEFGFSSNEGMYAITTFTDNSFALCGFETANSTRNAVLIRVNEEVIEEEIEAMTSLEIYNEPITCNITTEVTGEGGTISGQDDTVYETVNWGADATKEIVVTANTGYIIKSITIEKTDDAGTVTTENVTLDADTNTYTITPITSLKENINVIAEFEKIAAKVIVHHYITGTTTQVPSSDGGTVADEEYVGTVGEEYTTTDTSDINTRYYELAETPDNATGTFIEGTIEVIYYYSPVEYTYTIYYYYDGTEDTSKRESLKAGYNTQVTEYPDKAGTGYKLDSTTNVPLTITSSTNSNRMRIYYVTDENQRKDLTYTVEYYKDGNIVSADTQTVTENVQVLEADTLTVDKTTINTTDKYEGYTLESTSPTTIPDTIDSGETIKVYYVKRTDLSYTVNYYEEGTTTKVADSKTVNNQTFDAQVTENAIDVAGYNKVGDTESTITIKVSGNVINFYYAKRTDLSYTVKYLEQGINTELANTKTVNGQTYKSTVTENAIDIEGYDKVDPTSANITIEVSGNEITFYYTKRTDLSYTVKYLEQGTNTELANTKTVDGQTYKSTVTENAIDIEGYDKVNPTSANIAIEVSGNEITFYYTKRTDLSYTVKYLEQGTNTELANTKTVNGQTYKSTVTENAIDIEGYDKVDPASANITIEVSGNEITFYYTKRTDLSYTVKYLEKDTDAVLSNEKTVAGQTFKSEVTENAIDIEGYDKVDPTEKSIEIAVSGNEIIFYYTKRTDLSYTVKYLEKDTNAVLSAEKVEDGQTYKAEATESAIDIEGYDKVDPTEKSITIEVTGNEITFYYTKRTDLSYTVKYLEKDTDAVLSQEKTVNNQIFKSTITENAIDIEGYDKVDPTEKSIEIAVSGNEITFYYTKRTDLSYTVKYLEEGTDAVLSQKKVVEGQTFQTTVEEQAIDITGYTKVNLEESITIEVSGNEIIFYYKKVEGLSYTVNYYEEGTTTSVATSKVVDGKIFEDQVTENAIDVEGYNKVDPTEQSIVIGVRENVINFYYTKRTDLSYTVKYLEKDSNVELTTAKTVNNKTFKETVTENAIDIEGYDKVDPTEKSIEIAVSGNEIAFYYTKRVDLSYTVKYLEKDTDAVLSEEKTVNGQTYKSTVTENAIDIEGYDKVDPTEKSIEIAVSGNEIVFYYTKRVDLSYTVKYLEKDTDAVLSNEKAVDGQTFKSTITENAIDIEGYDKVEPTSANITIEVNGNEITFYYTKRTNLSYTVKYLEQGTDAVLSQEKVVEGQTFQATVEEQAIDITGYTKVNSEESITIQVSGNEIIFYYKKVEGLSYTVNYYEEGTTTSVATSKVVDGKVFEDQVTETAIDIEGYNKVDPTEKSIVIGVGENVINFYYTKRTDLSYTVKYLEQGSNEVLATEKVVNNKTFKETVIENAIDIEGYDKVDPTEKSIEIAISGNEIVFYYTKRVDLSYTVKYLEEGTDAVLSEEKTVDGQIFKSTITENAIDIEGYDKVAPTEKSIEMAVSGNEIVFYYTKRVDLSYTVKYLEEGTDAVLSQEKVVEGQTFQATVEEQAIDITGYTKVNSEESITIQVSGNEIIFYYKKVEGLSYTVNYYEEGTTTSVATSKVVDGKVFEDQVTENAIDVEGYNKVDPTEQSIVIGVGENVINFYYTKRTDLSYTVKYLEKDSNVELATTKTVNNKTFKETVTENAIDIEGYDKVDPTEKSIEIAVSGNEIVFYYTKRVDLSYTVKYLEKDTNAVLSAEKVENNQTYKAEVTENAIDIEGYDKVSPTEQSIEIAVSGNEITFYYTKRVDLSYTVKYLEEGTEKVLSAEKVVEGQTFQATVEEQAIDITGYTKVNPEESITIQVSGNEIIFYYKKVEGLSYTVNYYEEGTTTSVATSKVVDGKIFEDQVTETAIDVEGYNKVDPTENTIIIGVGENVINFYYTKRTDLSYTVKYLEQDTNEELLSEKVVTDKTYKETIKETSVEISGYNQVNVEETITMDVSGNEIIFYYTKRVDLSYTVKYLEKDTNVELATAKTVNNKTFKETVTENAIDIEGYDKVDPTEKSIEIAVSGNEIVFYYTKRVDLSYTVKYLEKDTDAELAETKTVNNKTFKETVIENAIDIEGYDKVDPTEKSIEIAVSGNEIVFYYTKRVDLSYTVKYLEKDTDAELAETKTVNNKTFKETVTENAIDIEGYDKVEPTSANITIEVSGNEIVFYYTKRVDLGYTVKYLEQGTEKVLSTEKVVEGQTFQATVEEQAIDITGYTKVNPEESITIQVSGNEIIFYYKKVEGLSYTVNYYEEGTTTSVATSKVVDGKVFEDQVTENAIDVEGYNKVDPTEQSIVIGVGENVINFYYTKRTDLSYTVKYLEQGSNEVLATEKTVNNKTFKETITESAIDIEGYDKVDPTEQSIEIAVSGNEIVFYYTKRVDLSYTVKYLEQDSNKVLKEEKVVTGKTFKETIIENTVEITGYNPVNTQETIEIAVSGNEITFYYTKKSDLVYTIEYYYEDKIDESKTETHTATFLDEIESYTDNCSAGYKLKEEVNFPLIVTANAEDNVIKIYYEIDDSQRKEIKYTVEYYKEGVLVDMDTDVNTKDVQLLDEETLTVDKTEINITDKYFGYRFDKTEPAEIPDTVNNGDVIKVYYVIDESHTKDLHYTVEYYQEGVLVEADTQIVEETVQILQPDTMDVNKGEINTVNKYAGYKLDTTTPNPIPDKITTGETIKVYYVIDENQRKDLSYTIEYYKDGEKQVTETKEVSINVQLLQPDTIPVDQSEMVLSGKYVGYKLEKTSPETIPSIANNGDVIKIYYVKDQFNYTVEYYYDGIIENEATDTFTATYMDVIKEYTDKNKFGYRLEKTEGLPLEISEKSEENVIKVYYIIDDGNTKTLNYTVEYYMDGVLQEGDTQIEYKTVQVLQPDTFEVDKTKINLVDKYVGYKLETTNPDPIQDVATTGDVIKVYYVKDTFGYTVEYYYEGEIAPEKTENLSALYKTVIDTYPDKINEKYYLDYTENFPMEISEDPSKNVIKVYYAKKLSTITVHYYWDGVNNVSSKQKSTTDVGEDGKFSVSQDVIIEDKVDTVHKIAPATDVADKYELITRPEIEEITMTVEPIEVEYIYRLKDTKVIVNYIEKSSGKILGTDTITGQVDDKYQAIPEPIKGFDFMYDEVPDNQVGKMTLEPTTVNFYYVVIPQGPAPSAQTPSQTTVSGVKGNYKGSSGPYTGDNEVVIHASLIIIIMAANAIQITICYDGRKLRRIRKNKKRAPRINRERKH